MLFTIYKKEKIYFNIMCSVGIVVWGSLLVFALLSLPLLEIIQMVGAWSLFIITLKACLSFLIVSHLRGNAIRVQSEQFPDLFKILQDQSARLELKRVPTMYLLQGGGLLNAFAVRLVGKNYVVLYSDVVEVAYKEGRAAVEFIMGHELGHIKRKHVHGFKSFLIWPARLVPFLSNAYSRACEYTCDNIGYFLSPAGAQAGILILAAGKELYKRVNIKTLLSNRESEKHSLWISEIFSTHPHLINRVASLDTLHKNNVVDDLEINPATSVLFKYSSSSKNTNAGDCPQDLLKSSYDDFYGKQKDENQK